MATSLAGGGCVSAFTDGAADWTPAEGAPTCNPALGVAADVAILALSVTHAEEIAGTAAGLACFDPMSCLLIGGGAALGAIGGGVIGVGGGMYKMHTCGRAKRAWRRTHGADDAGVLLAIADETGSVVDVYGDTIILRAERVDLCSRSTWFHRIHAHRQELAARGITHVSCRVGRLAVWDGRLPP